MKKYIRLLRLQDQYVQIAAILTTTLFLGTKDIKIFYWIIGCTCFSFVAFIVNELVDQKDTDKYSWNKIHIGSSTIFDKKIIASMLLVFSLIGFYFSYLSNLLFLGFLVFAIGILYSLKPIRLKGKLALDLLAQTFVWWVLPSLGVYFIYGKSIYFLPILFLSSLIITAVLLPYQLADYKADLKAGLKCTHVVLGVKNSIFLGIFVNIIGLFMYFYLGLFYKHFWSLPLILISVAIILPYLFWLRLKTIEEQTLSMQKYVGIVKPLTQLIVPYLLFLLYTS